MLRFIVNYGNLKWFTGNRKWSRYVFTIYLNQICIGPSNKCLLGIGILSLCRKSRLAVELQILDSCSPSQLKCRSRMDEVGASGVTGWEGVEKEGCGLSGPELDWQVGVAADEGAPQERPESEVMEEVVEARRITVVRPPMHGSTVAAGLLCHRAQRKTVEEKLGVCSVSPISA